MLSEYTTLGLGGPASRIVPAATEADLVALAPDAALILAGGSNVVIADEGVDGTVVLLRTRGIEISGGVVRVAAGEDWDAVVALAVSSGLAGIECLSGIPGSTGATPIQNVGAYGQEVASVVASVRVLDRETGAIEEWGPERCGFGYRSSVFKYRSRWVVLAVTFALEESPASMPIAYAELASALGVAVGERAPLDEVRAAVLALRRGKGMVVDPADPDSRSAGSFFTNPILSAADFATLAARAPTPPPSWPEPDGRVKTSAAWLIQRAGFDRGYGDGRIGISSKHTLALVNRGGGTTTELLTLARHIATTVEQRFGVALHPEPVLVGVDW